MTNLIITSNSKVGENIFHCWNSENSFIIFTQRGKVGIDNAYRQLRKLYPNLTMSITHSAAKNDIKYYFN